MTNYLVFHYQIQEEAYIEAYPAADVDTGLAGVASIPCRTGLIPNQLPQMLPY